MSLIVQPAPLIRKDPVANSASRDGSPIIVAADIVVAAVAVVAATVAVVVVIVVVAAVADMVGEEAIAVLHRHGQRSSIVPMGLSSLASCAYG